MTTSSAADPEKTSGEGAGYNPALSRIPALDGLRGVAILLVLYWHYVGGLLPAGAGGPVPLVKLSSLAWSGVDLFFVLSGFLIGSILLEHRGAKNYFKVFYLRRACRIFPLYYGMVAVYLVGAAAGWGEGGWFGSLFHFDPLPAVGYLTHTQNYFMIGAGTTGPKWLDVTWSLAIEEQFYLLLAPLVFCLPERRLRALCIVCILAAPVCRAVAVTVPLAPLWVHFGLPMRFDGLFWGVLLALAVRSGSLVRLIEGNREVYLAVFGALFVGLLALCLVYPVNLMGTRSIVFVYSLLALFYASGLLLALFSGRGLIRTLLESRVLRFTGTISYSAYLFHNPVLRLVHAGLLDQLPQMDSADDLAAAALALALTAGLSWVSFRFFERKIIRWGHRLRYHAG